jgi:hypothetical protein
LSADRRGSPIIFEIGAVLETRLPDGQVPNHPNIYREGMTKKADFMLNLSLSAKAGNSVILIFIDWYSLRIKISSTPALTLTPKLSPMAEAFGEGLSVGARVKRFNFRQSSSKHLSGRSAISFFDW